MSFRFAWRAGVVLLSIALVGAAALLRNAGATSPPPARAALAGRSLTRHLRVGSYEVNLRVTPNRPEAIGRFSVCLSEHDRPVTGARVTLTTLMAGMPMGYTGRLTPRGTGSYAHAWPGLMRGRWRLHYAIAPPAGRRFNLTVVDDVR
jgi:hypothetical protein